MFHSFFAMNLKGASVITCSIVDVGGNWVFVMDSHSEDYLPDSSKHTFVL